MPDYDSLVLIANSRCHSLNMYGHDLVGKPTKPTGLSIRCLPMRWVPKLVADPEGVQGVRLIPAPVFKYPMKMK